MQPIDFPGTNFTFNKPASTTDEQCGALKVQKGMTNIYGDLFMVNISAWKPGPEDIERINSGGFIYLHIFGQGHPMVSVATDKIELEVETTKGMDQLTDD